MAAWFAAITPYRTAGRLHNQGGAYAADIGAPDERQHANYIAHLSQGKGFPVFRPGSEDLYETYQSHQPPLYYIIASGFHKLIGSPPLDKPGFQPIRLLNALIGGITVFGVALLAYWSTRNYALAITASAITAFLPMHVALSGAISNDPLLFCLCTWVLALIANAVQRGWGWADAVAAALMTGLALLTKTTALALVPALIAGLIVSPQPRSGGKPALAGACVAVACAIPLAWWIRNMQLYGDPLAMRAFNDAFAGSAQASMFTSEPSIGVLGYWKDWVGFWTMRSFVGAFGYMDIFLPKALYQILALILFGLAAIGAISARKVLEPAESRTLVPAWIFIGVVVLLFVRFNMQYFQGQARYLYPAIGPISVLISLGIARLFGKRLMPVGMAVATGLLVLSIYCAAWLPGEFAKRVLGP